MLIKIST
jgi:GPI ethanolamine phosphate transferase 2/3 subunit F